MFGRRLDFQRTEQRGLWNSIKSESVDSNQPPSNKDGKKIESKAGRAEAYRRKCDRSGQEKQGSGTQMDQANGTTPPSLGFFVLHSQQKARWRGDPTFQVE